MAGCGRWVPIGWISSGAARRRGARHGEPGRLEMSTADAVRGQGVEAQKEHTWGIIWAAVDLRGLEPPTLPVVRIKSI